MGKSAIASEVWRAMAHLSFSAMMRGRHLAVLKELGLTPGHFKALGALDPMEPRPMRALADSIGCDASTATWLVDRLEERGLVERRSLPTDRRVKTIALTPSGIRTRERILEGLYEPPPDLLELDVKARKSLQRELAKLPERPLPFWGGAGSSSPT
jgi:DNA-binding MarR family transcriptional regulator